jgi:hypothetical protein
MIDGQHASANWAKQSRGDRQADAFCRAECDPEARDRSTLRC